MFSDYRAFGAAPSQIVTVGIFIAGKGETLHVVALDAAELGDVNPRFPKPQVVASTTDASNPAVNPAPSANLTVNLAAGMQLTSVSSCEVISGLVQIFWFKI